jgi:hypothetical protein
MLDTIKRDWKGVIFQSVMGAVFLIAFLLLATIATGGIERESQAVRYQKATACILVVPIDENGRDASVVAECFTNEGLPVPASVMNVEP